MADFNRGRSRGNFRKRGFDDRGFGGGRNFERPTMHKAVCDNCGKGCEVPFRPTNGKPVYCSSCFENNRPDSRGSEGRSFQRSSFEEKRMFDAVCDECGNSCQVPFQPRGDKPVYCSNCFGNKGNRSRGRGMETSNSQYEEQFALLNSKIDQVLNILRPVVEEVAAEEAMVEEVLEEKVKTPKKSASKKK